MDKEVEEVIGERRRCREVMVRGAARRLPVRLLLACCPTLGASPLLLPPGCLPPLAGCLPAALPDVLPASLHGCLLHCLLRRQLQVAVVVRGGYVAAHSACPPARLL